MSSQTQVISLGFFFFFLGGGGMGRFWIIIIYIIYIYLLLKPIFVLRVYTLFLCWWDRVYIYIYISISYNSQRRTTYVWNVSVSLLYYIFQNVYDGNYLVTKKTQVTVPDHRRVVMVCCTEAQLMIPQLKSVKCEPRYKTYLCESSVPKIYPNYTSQSQ